MTEASERAREMLAAEYRADWKKIECEPITDARMGYRLNCSASALRAIEAALATPPPPVSEDYLRGIEDAAKRLDARAAMHKGFCARW